jgi:hypothetical protein
VSTEARPGEVWLVDFGLAAKVRPVVVLSVPQSADARSLVVVAPLTSQLRGLRGEVDIGKPRWLPAKALGCKCAGPSQYRLSRARKETRRAFSGAVRGSKIRPSRIVGTVSSIALLSAPRKPVFPTSLYSTGTTPARKATPAIRTWFLRANDRLLGCERNFVQPGELARRLCPRRLRGALSQRRPESPPSGRCRFLRQRLLPPPD